MRKLMIGALRTAAFPALGLLLPALRLGLAAARLLRQSAA